MTLATRRVLPKNANEVRDQLGDIGRRVQNDALSVGDRGDAVGDLQKRLRSFGHFTGKANGVFDARTEAAVRSFQQAAGIVVDGVAGQQTLGAIRDHTSFVQDDFRTVGTRNQRGVDVARAERMLKDLGMKPGSVDGLYDRATAEAVKRFTEANPNLPDRTSLDGRTFDALRAQSAESLQQGSTSPGVAVLEANLKTLGHNAGTVDQQFTANTRKAVLAFQTKNNLDATGVADVKTRRAIQKAVDDKVVTPAEQMKIFDKTPPKADYRRVQVSPDGDLLNRRTNRMMERAEFIMRNKFGHKDFNFSVIQGSYSGTVAASGNTHDRGGAIDVHTRTLPKNTVDDMITSLRMAGFAAWGRGRGADNFDPHIHAIAIGDRELTSAAAAQVQEYFNGGDGLVGGAADPDRHLGRPVPRWAQKFNH